MPAHHGRAIAAEHRGCSGCAGTYIKLSRTQLAIRKVQLGPHREWLSELEGVEPPGTAHQMLEFLLSGGESAPYQGEVITEKLTDLAITQARLTDSGKDFVPTLVEL